MNEQKKQELDAIISEESLKPEGTYSFINNAFKNGEIQSSGTAFAKILPPVSGFTATGYQTKKKDSVLKN